MRHIFLCDCNQFLPRQKNNIYWRNFWFENSEVENSKIRIFRKQKYFRWNFMISLNHAHFNAKIISQILFSIFRNFSRYFPEIFIWKLPFLDFLAEIFSILSSIFIFLVFLLLSLFYKNLSNFLFRYEIFFSSSIFFSGVFSNFSQKIFF